MMKYYIKLRDDLDNGRITQDQFNVAVSELGVPVVVAGKKSKKKRGKNNLDEKEKTRRKELKNLVKWIFDVELDNPNTPLYVKTGDMSEALNQVVFIIRSLLRPKARKC